MQKKSFFFGLGTGIIVMCLIFYFLYTFEMKKMVQTNNETTSKQALTDDEIKVKARELGMVTVSEASEKTPGASLSDEEIMLKAESLGMTRPSEEIAIDDESPDSETDISANEQSGLELSDEQAGLDTDEQEYITLTIPRGVTSAQIARTLYEMDLIDDQEAFNDYIKEKSMSRRIMTGSYSIRRGADFDEILGVIAFPQ